MKNTKKTELLAPAGNMNKLITAAYFGADAVYAAARRFGLRAYADNFTVEELKTAADYLHALGKKLYVTVNIYADDDDISELPAFARELASTGADGVLVSDLGVFSVFRKNAPSLDLHVSTQANVTNSEAAVMWAELGAKRIVLARETRLDDIRRIRDALPPDVEIEAFVHGAMCIAYSGRCLLSAYFTDRSGNKGECVQSCRWEYGLMEKSRGDVLRAEEDGRGTYLLSSKDLRMIDRLGELIGAGVDSLKIEGRVKSEYYVAGVTNAYRRALDAFLGRQTAVVPTPAPPTLPVRPPVLCAGCPHRASFYTVKKAMRGRKTLFCGDIGCYTLGNAKPLDMVDTCLCMGAGINIAQGVTHVEPDTAAFAFVGDSTFFASGITGVVNAFYNQANMTLVVLDNSTTAMTGHQPHPGTGRTMMGQVVEKVSIERVLLAIGLTTVETVDPLDLEAAVATVRRVADEPGVKAIIFRSPCVVLAKPQARSTVDAERCVGCQRCVRELGCPALVSDAATGKVAIDAAQCTGCTLCEQICPTHAISGGERL